MKRPTEMHLMDFLLLNVWGESFLSCSGIWIWVLKKNAPTTNKKKSIENLEKVLSIKKEEAVTVFSSEEEKNLFKAKQDERKKKIMNERMKRDKPICAQAFNRQRKYVSLVMVCNVL